MYEIIFTICLWQTALSPTEPICFISAKAMSGMTFESESGCHLVLGDITRSLDADLRARAIGLGMVCHKIDTEEVDKIPGTIHE